MEKTISGVMLGLAEIYAESEFIYRDRDIGIYKARSELLGGAEVSIYHIHTNTPRYITGKDGLEWFVSPVVADRNGILTDMNGESIQGFKVDGDFRIEIKSRSGAFLFCTDVEV